MSKDLRELVEQLNNSGFPFQLRVTKEISDRSKHHHWEIQSTEHLWHNSKTEANGYIDIIINKNRARLVIECKRMLGATWIFLLNTKQPHETVSMRALFRESSNLGDSRIGWSEGNLHPSSYTSDVCIVARAKKNDLSLLEHIATPLIDSIECLAEEEDQIRRTWTNLDKRAIPPLLQQSRDAEIPEKAIYIPAIVTNAELQICSLNLDDVSLDQGQISNDKASFQPVHYVRFAKPLESGRQLLEAEPLSLRESNNYNQRSILVIQASSLTEFLERCTSGF